MEAQLNLDLHVRSDAGQPVSEAFTALRSELAALEWWSDLRSIACGTRVAQLTDSTVESAIRDAQGNFVLVGEDSGNDVFLFRIRYDQRSLTVTHRCGGRHLEERRQSLLQDWIALTTRWHGKVHSGMRFGPITRAYLVDIDYPRPRPPRVHRWYGPRGVLDFADRSGPTTTPSEYVRVADVLGGARLPEFAHRIELDGLVVIEWMSSLDLPSDEVGRRLGAREAWIGEALNARLAGGWNEAGDKQLLLPDMEEHDELTLYSASGAAALVPIVLDAGELPEEVTKLESWRSQRRTTGGTALQWLGLVLPSRGDAVLAHGLVGQRLDAVLYVDDNGLFWDPFPEGDWIEP